MTAPKRQFNMRPRKATLHELEELAAERGTTRTKMAIAILEEGVAHACRACRGTGAHGGKPLTAKKPCGRCNGTGRRKKPGRTG
jgi:DnaJ-class molecular chaperone